MTMQTNSQKMSQTAYGCIIARTVTEQYVSFSREFPSLVHSCGLGQAVAFALAKDEHQRDYIGDLTKVLGSVGLAEANSLDQIRVFLADENTSVGKYIRVSRAAMQAANWLKRYAEATKVPEETTEETTDASQEQDNV